MRLYLLAFRLVELVWQWGYKYASDSTFHNEPLTLSGSLTAITNAANNRAAGLISTKGM